MLNQVVFAFFNNTHQLLILRLMLLHVKGVVLKQLEQEGPIKTIAISPQSPYVFVTTPTLVFRKHQLLETQLKLCFNILIRNN